LRARRHVAPQKITHRHLQDALVACREAIANANHFAPIRSFLIANASLHELSIPHGEIFFACEEVPLRHFAHRRVNKK